MNKALPCKNCKVASISGITAQGDCMSYQQSAIAHGYVDSVEDVRATFTDMCSNGTGAQCRSYFVVLLLNGYATHAIFAYRISNYFTPTVTFVNLPFLARHASNPTAVNTVWQWTSHAVSVNTVLWC